MSCWSGFWFFVSCHSVMAFPSFTIRRAGAGMLSFHFPRVSNSWWPAMPLSWSCCMSSFQHGVLATQNVLTLWVSPDATGPISTFSEFPNGPHGRAQFPANIYTFTYTQAYTYAHSYKCEQRTFGDISRCSASTWTSALSHFFIWENTPYLLMLKKKRKHSMCPSYFFQSGRSTWVLW